MDGEPKREMYDLLPSHLYPSTIYVSPELEPYDVITMIEKKGISYPFIVKPDVGGQGILFRKIDDEDQWLKYHNKVPFDYVLQDLITYPMEVSVFYIRHPKETKGRITGFLHKIPMKVTGDGQSTLSQLIDAHPKAAKRKESLIVQHEAHLIRVLAKGETYQLSFAANHNRGAQFVDLKSEIDERLLAVFDRLSLDLNDFFYGRYDIMCRSVDDLKNGNHFMILEYNGCGAEPNHFYDTGYTLFRAYGEILKHWRFLYQISRYNAKRGVRPWPFLKGYRFLKATQKKFQIMREADLHI
jgi:hypothetical protein